MRRLGIRTGADLRARSEAELVRRFGKVGAHYFRISRGIDDRAVAPDRPPKSIGAERTFAHDLTDLAAMLDELAEIADTVARRMAGDGESSGRTVTLKIKHHDFTVQTRQQTLERGVGGADDLLELGTRLLHKPAPPTRPVRLLGLSVSNFAARGARLDQLTLDL